MICNFEANHQACIPRCGVARESSSPELTVFVYQHLSYLTDIVKPMSTCKFVIHNMMYIHYSRKKPDIWQLMPSKSGSGSSTLSFQWWLSISCGTLRSEKQLESSSHYADTKFQVYQSTYLSLLWGWKLMMTSKYEFQNMKRAVTHWRMRRW